MSWLRISEVARQMRLRPSAIRYHEQLEILPKPERISGKRCYDRTVLYRLAVIQQAREAGFALQEIRTLFFGFQEGTRAEARWRRLADRKLAELDTLAGQIRWMRTLLKRMRQTATAKPWKRAGRQFLRTEFLELKGHRFESSRSPADRLLDQPTACREHMNQGRGYNVITFVPTPESTERALAVLIGLMVRISRQIDFNF